MQIKVAQFIAGRGRNCDNNCQSGNQRYSKPLSSYSSNDSADNDQEVTAYIDIYLQQT